MSPPRASLLERPFFALLLCFVATIAAYAPALGGGFVWDDAYLVGENPFFRSPVFSLEVFRHWLFFESFSTYYRPIQNLSYLVDYWLWRGAPLGYHITNVALHAAAGFLLCLLLRRLLPTLVKFENPSHSRILALLVALLWTVHPIHNAAVAYVSGRADSLAAVFALAAWLIALRAEEASRPAARAALGTTAFLFILAALCSKEIGLMWLLLFLGHTWWKGGFSLRARISFTAAATLAFAAYAALHSLPAAREKMEDAAPAPLEARALLMLRAVGDYTGLMFYPGRLMMERELSDHSAYRSATTWRTRSRGEWLTITGFLALLAGGALCRWRAPGRTLRLAGAAWFGIAFLPISNLFPLNAEVAEHWIYLASIGFLLFVAGVAVAAPPRFQRIVIATACLGIFALGARTALRAADWVDAETFCQRTIAAGGASPRILSTLAGIYAQRRDWPRQEHVLRKTLEHFPHYTPARLQLGVCLTRQGRATEAEPLLAQTSDQSAESARRFPRTWSAALSLARLRYEAGDISAALTVLGESRSRFPATWDLVRYEAELCRQQDGAASALPTLEAFAAAQWWHLDAWLALAQFRAESGQFELALAALRHADRLDLYDGRSLAAIARLELARGDSTRALDAQLAAIERNGTHPTHYLELGAILDQLGRRAEAAGALRKAQLLATRATSH